MKKNFTLPILCSAFFSSFDLAFFWVSFTCSSFSIPIWSSSHSSNNNVCKSLEQCLERFGPEYFSICCSQMFFLVISILLRNKSQNDKKVIRLHVVTVLVYWKQKEPQIKSMVTCMYCSLFKTIIKMLVNYYKSDILLTLRFLQQTHPRC